MTCAVKHGNNRHPRNIITLTKPPEGKRMKYLLVNIYGIAFILICFIIHNFLSTFMGIYKVSIFRKHILPGYVFAWLQQLSFASMVTDWGQF